MNDADRRDAGPRPRVFVNSLPKAGTNLVASILKLMPGLTSQPLRFNRRLGSHPLNYLYFFSKKTALAGIDAPITVKFRVLQYLFRKLRTGAFTAGHLPFQQIVLDLLKAEGIRTIFVIRDPRDVVVSKMHFNVKRDQHFLHKHYKSLATDRDRISAAICGIKKPSGEYLALGIDQKLDSVRQWLHAPGIMSVRFEDCIGAAGGGDAQKQSDAILSLADHIGLQMSADEAQRIGENMYGTGWTFRKGAIGDWKNHLDDELKHQFKERAGQHLIELGYENDLNW